MKAKTKMQFKKVGATAVLTTSMVTSMMGGVYADTILPQDALNENGPSDEVNARRVGHAKPETKQEARANLAKAEAAVKETAQAVEASTRDVEAANKEVSTAQTNDENAKAAQVSAGKAADQARAEIVSAKEKELTAAEKNLESAQTDVTARRKTSDAKKKDLVAADEAEKQAKKKYDDLLAANPNAEKEVETKPQKVQDARHAYAVAENGRNTERELLKSAEEWVVRATEAKHMPCRR